MTLVLVCHIVVARAKARQRAKVFEELLALFRAEVCDLKAMLRNSQHLGELPSPSRIERNNRFSKITTPDRVESRHSFS